MELKIKVVLKRIVNSVKRYRKVTNIVTKPP